MAYYHRTQQYSVTALTDLSGMVVERYAYDAYGNLSVFDRSGTARTATAEGNRYTYTGREWDDELSLYHYRARMYDPVSGRFLGRDPIGFAGGLNGYSYVFGRPAVLIDPAGLFPPYIGPGWPWPPATNPPSDSPGHVPYNPTGPIDDRPIDHDVDISTYNCAGFALRTYEFEGDREKLKAKLAPYETDCNQDCKCGQTKCRLWQWVLRMYRKSTGKFVVEMNIDFHIVCSKIPESPGAETGPEPLCYEKFGDGPITGPIHPSNGTPVPGDVPNVPDNLVPRLEEMKQTCYCIPDGVK